MNSRLQEILHITSITIAIKTTEKNSSKSRDSKVSKRASASIAGIGFLPDFASIGKTDSGSLCICVNKVKVLYFGCTWIVLSLHIPNRAMCHQLRYEYCLSMIVLLHTWILASNKISIFRVLPSLLLIYKFISSSVCMGASIAVYCMHKHMYTWYMYASVCLQFCMFTWYHGSMAFIETQAWRVGNQSFQFFPFLYWFI